MTKKHCRRLISEGQTGQNNTVTTYWEINVYLKLFSQLLVDYLIQHLIKQYILSSSLFQNWRNWNPPLLKLQKWWTWWWGFEFRQSDFRVGFWPTQNMQNDNTDSRYKQVFWSAERRMPHSHSSSFIWDRSYRMIEFHQGSVSSMREYLSQVIHTWRHIWKQSR